jgi:hypothetical protein
MSDKHAIARYRHWYRKLLRFYSKPYRERFAEGMEQTFNDLCRERSEAGKGLLGFVIWVLVETLAGIIREHARLIAMQSLTRRLSRWAIVVAVILLVPFLAMQLDWSVPDPGSPAPERVNWSLVDFVFAGMLLFGAALTYELVARKGGTTAYRAAVGIACAAGLLLVWVNGAVGIIGSEDNSANLLYFGVLAVALIGMFIARFQPRGMARVLFATALAQALVPVMALVFWPQVSWGAAGVPGVFVLNAFFVGLWIVSALLFRHAGDLSPTLPGKVRESGASRQGVIS